MLYCPDCGVKGRLTPERDEETDELVGFECDACHNLFDDAVIDEDDEPRPSSSIRKRP